MGAVARTFRGWFGSARSGSTIAGAFCGCSDLEVRLSAAATCGSHAAGWAVHADGVATCYACRGMWYEPGKQGVFVMDKRLSFGICSRSPRNIVSGCCQDIVSRAL